MNRYTLQWTISDEAHGSLIRDFLLQHISLSNRLLIKVKQQQDGGIFVNGERKTVRYVLKQADKLQIFFPKEEISPYLQPEEMPLHIVYEDDDLLVINKRAGMPTMPSRIHPHGTLANGILAYYQMKNIPYTVHVVTRLDKDTSGLVLIAKHQYSHSYLSNMQRNHDMERIYTAIVHGEIKNKQGVINQPIGRHPDSIIERMVTPEGKEAKTFYDVKKRRYQVTTVNVSLETGRTHQIRVHFAYIGHPLVGDELYGGSREKIKRQALHCSVIKFQHPFTQRQLVFTAPLPRDMKFL